jgi:hypothetical protein
MSTYHRSSVFQRTLGIVLVLGFLLGLSGCGTFRGMSWEERDQANKDLAGERNYSFKPERSLQDNREIPAYPTP